MLDCGSVAQECFIYFHLICLIELCQQIRMRVSDVKIVKHANSDTQSNKDGVTLFQSVTEFSDHLLISSYK